MRFTSIWALVSVASLPLAGVVYLFGRLVGDWMVAADRGWEMAFYWSPLAFLAIDTVLVVGAIAGAVGLAAGPGVRRRAQAVAAVSLCAGCFVLVPWR